MEAIIERCAGIDVGQATVAVTVLLGPAHQKTRKITRTFRTMTRELLDLREWLLSEQVTHVGMESTGIYWKPVYALLEGAFEIIVANATRIKNIPGRKTDVKDSEWIADLVRHGLVAKSFVPPKPIRELRDMVRCVHRHCVLSCASCRLRNEHSASRRQELSSVSKMADDRPHENDVSLAATP